MRLNGSPDLAFKLKLPAHYIPSIYYVYLLLRMRLMSCSEDVGNHFAGSFKWAEESERDGQMGRAEQHRIRR